MDADLSLMERWREGDAGAGQDLFKRHFAEILRFFSHKCRGDADDLVQRTFLQCVRARDRFRGLSTFRTYLFAIARHELYAHLREVRRDPALDFEVTSVADVVTSAGTRLARAEQIERLRAALATLPADAQLLLEMHHWHDLDSTALGEIFGMPPATVRTRLARARKALRARLDGAEAGPAGDPLSTALSRGDDEPG